ncbi:MAG TPA: GGDEF domain-containing protein [Bryobacteraceae bacterium]|nr:GGDEF domain-containing protein [Bryobacteraceae bacterium]
MISLRKHIELHPGQVLEAALDAYRESLDAMGVRSAEVCPALGPDLQDALSKIKAKLSSDAGAESMAQSGKKVADELEDWGRRASAYYKEKAAEAREIMVTLAQTAEVIAERDNRYAGQFGDLTGTLKAIANLDDLTQIRQSILHSASKLSSYVERLTKENEQSVRHLRSELATFQSRLEEAERQASQDPLTGLCNRRYTEAQIRMRVEKALPFCILVLDLNGFKKVNDSHGHIAGDELLKQFAARLRSALRSSDIVGRWGGDEFVVVLDCEAVQASSRVVSIHKKLAGGYAVSHRPGLITLTAAVGLAACHPGDTLAALFERADEAMYQQKRDARRNGGPHASTPGTR